MLTPRLTNCAECEDICSLIESIDCKVAEMSVSLYNNVVFMLNKSFDHELLSDLLNYKRILQYKVCNPNYAGCFTVNMIASKVRRFTSGCIKDCSCRASGAGIIITTTSTSTIPPLTTTTTTSSTSSTTTTSTTLSPTTSTTSSSTSSSTSTTTSSSSTTTTTTTTINPELCILPDVTIGTQTWTVCNLNVSRYRNGDIIPQATSAIEWTGLTTGAWCWYNFDPANEEPYKKIYNWYAVTDPRGLAPVGYHIPTDAEFSILRQYLDPAGTEFVNTAGASFKETGITHWNTPNTGATNATGFTGLPGGLASYFGTFMSINNYGYWWAFDEYSSILGWQRNLAYNTTNFIQNGARKDSGLSVRCLKDSDTTTTTTTIPPTGFNTIYTHFEAL
jgi:uncharacterized protein (TIGR02145 family)